jgi:hypothetical protein
MYSIWSRITCTLFVSRKGSDTPGFLVLWRGRLQLPKHHAFVTTPLSPRLTPHSSSSSSHIMPTVNDVHQQQYRAQIMIRLLRGFWSLNIKKTFQGRHRLSGTVFASLQIRLEQSRTLGAERSLSTSVPSLQFHKARSLTESRRKTQHYRFNLLHRK